MLTWQVMTWQVMTWHRIFWKYLIINLRKKSGRPGEIFLVGPVGTIFFRFLDFRGFLWDHVLGFRGFIVPFASVEQ